MAVIEFQGYNVLETIYRRNNNFNNSIISDDGIDLTPELTAHIEVEEDNAKIDLILKSGSIDNESSPFKVEVQIRGYFSYNLEEDEDNIGFDSFLKMNGTAILYPYVRALVSTLTNSSNEYPGFNLPTINISKVLQDQEKE